MRVEKLRRGRIVLEPDQPFDLDLTLSCGQVFRWEKKGGWWTGTIGEHWCRVRQEGRALLFEGTDEETLVDYLQLDLDLDAITDSFDKDEVIHRAIGACRGLRIVRQPAWECLISYICATYSNIPMIKRRIEEICRRLGTRVETPCGEFHLFPTPEALSGAPPGVLRECRAGYRGCYIRGTAHLVAGDTMWEARIRVQPYQEARKTLMEFPGVGRKVADCILLFAFGRYEAFPVDIWIRRIMEKEYPEALEGTGDVNERIGSYGRRYFGRYAGYAQEYLYASRLMCPPPSQRGTPAGSG